MGGLLLAEDGSSFGTWRKAEVGSDTDGRGDSEKNKAEMDVWQIKPREAVREQRLGNTRVKRGNRDSLKP